VLRDGRVVADVPAGGYDEQALVDHIVGTSARPAGSSAAEEPRPVETALAPKGPAGAGRVSAARHWTSAGSARSARCGSASPSSPRTARCLA
jgi:hypothetical protein